MFAWPIVVAGTIISAFLVKLGALAVYCSIFSQALKVMSVVLLGLVTFLMYLIWRDTRSGKN